MISDKIDENAIECRICHSSTTQDLILSPCSCKGSLAYLHSVCLERWLNYASRDSCELCCYQFNAVLNRRYTFMQSVGLWIRHPANRNLILCDLTIGLILTILTLSSMIVCLVGLYQFTEIGNKSDANTTWSEGAVNVFLIIMLAGYMATMYSMAKDHIIPWYTWWTGCNTVRLIYDKNKYIPQQPLERNQSVIVNMKTCQQMLETDISNTIPKDKTLEHDNINNKININEFKTDCINDTKIHLDL